MAHLRKKTHKSMVWKKCTLEENRHFSDMPTFPFLGMKWNNWVWNFCLDWIFGEPTSASGNGRRDGGQKEGVSAEGVPKIQPDWERRCAHTYRGVEAQGLLLLERQGRWVYETTVCPTQPPIMVWKMETQLEYIYRHTLLACFSTFCANLYGSVGAY